MPILDRHWWLRVVLACGASTLALAYVAWCVRAALLIPPDSPLHPGPAVLVFAILIPRLLYLMVRYTIRIALLSRRRARLAAIRGDREAVPASFIVPHPERAPDVAVELLEIAWRPFSFRHIDTALAWVVLVLGLGMLLLITFFASLANAMTSSQAVPEILLHAMLSAIHISLLIIAVLLAVIAVATVISGVWSTGIASPIITFFGRPFDVVADAEGVTTHDLWGRTHHVRWDDARLLEVSIAPSVLGRYRVFTLYGRDSYARWRDDTGTNVKAPTRFDGITREEGAQRLQSLLDLIAARIGLTPRTFEETLAADRHPDLPPLLRRNLRMLKQALACATLATVSLFFPPASAGMLTLLPSVAYFILAAGCLVFMAIYRQHPPAAARQGARPVADGAFADQDAERAYSVCAFIPRAQTLTAFFVSLLICLAALPLLLAWFGTLDISVLHVFYAIQFASLWPSQAAAVLVGFAGGVGLLVCAIAVVTLFTKSGSVDVQGDAKGLRAPDASKDSFLPWDAVDWITRSAQDDGSYAYTVIGDYARTTITWSGGGATPAQADPRFLAVSAEQFAAIVVARSGKPLITR